MLTCQQQSCIIYCEVKNVNETERFSEFTLLVSGAYKSLRRAQEKYTKVFGLRSVHVACMLHLLEAPDGLSAAELSRLCGVDRAQISRVVAELAADGLIDGAAPVEKRRYRGRLTLTGQGRAQARAMSEIVSEKLNSVSSALASEDVETFYRVFREIAAKLDEI